MKTHSKNRSAAPMIAATVLLAALALPAEAKKPPKPPPPPPPPTGPGFTMYAFENGSVTGINRQMVVTGAVNGWPAVDLNQDFRFDDSAQSLELLPLPATWEPDGESMASDGGDPFLAATARGEEIESLWGDMVRPPRGVVWNSAWSDRTPHALGVLDWFDDETVVTAINIHDEVVGQCAILYSGSSSRSFVIRPESPEEDLDGNPWFRQADPANPEVNALMLPLGYPTGEADVVPVSVRMNDDGVLCGILSFPGGALREAFVIVPDRADADGDGNPWFADDGEGGNALLRKLPPLGSRDVFYAFDLNEQGEIVGCSGTHGLLWTPSGDDYVVVDLGSYSDRDFTRATHMTDVTPSGKRWVRFFAYDDPLRPKQYDPQLHLLWHDGVLYSPEDLALSPAGWEIRWLEDLTLDENGKCVLVGNGTFNGTSTHFVAIED